MVCHMTWSKVKVTDVWKLRKWPFSKSSCISFTGVHVITCEVLAHNQLWSAGTVGIVGIHILKGNNITSGSSEAVGYESMCTVQCGMPCCCRNMFRWLSQCTCRHTCSSSACWCITLVHRQKLPPRTDISSAGSRFFFSIYTPCPAPLNMSK